MHLTGRCGRCCRPAAGVTLSGVPGQLLSGLLLPLLAWGGFRTGRWFCTAYTTRLGHYTVAALLVGGAIYVLMTGDVQVTAWFVAAFAGFYAGLFIGGHQRLWAEEKRKAGNAKDGTGSSASGGLAVASVCAICGHEHAEEEACRAAAI